jgi:amidophosphoribosyltransferase
MAATPGTPGATSGATADAVPAADADPAAKAGATGCDPGPDAEFEELLTDADRVTTADKKEPV